MLLFKSLSYKNLLSSGNSKTTIDFTKNKLTLIVGKNGAGKSTMLDALTFSLYGKTFRSINKPLLVNSINKKDMLVEIEFITGGSSYLVRRGMKPNVFDIFKDGSIINADAASRDYQDYLEKHILKMNYKTFCQVVILGSSSFVPFMQLPAGARREVIEDLLDLEVFTIMNTLLKTQISETEQSIKQLSNDYELLSKKLELHQKMYDEMSTDNSVLLEEVSKKIDDLETKKTSEQTIISELLEQKQVLVEKIKNIDEVKTKLDKFKDSKYSLDSKLESLKKEVSFFTKHDNCPTCKQTIDVDFREKTLTEKSGLLTECETKMSDVLEKLQKTQLYLTKFSAIQDKIGQTTVQIAARMSTISNIEKNILDFEKQKTRLDGKKKEMMDNNDIKTLETEKELLLYEKNKLLHTKQLQQVTANMLKDSGIKSLIIKQYVPVINKLINKYLTTMEFFCNFTLDETFNETIKSRYRDDFSYFSFSEGEKRRIDLAILFAWRALAKLRNSASVNLLIFDEVLDSSTDQQGIETFFTLIKEEVEDTNVFVISHVQGAHESKFDRVLNFKKDKNFSVMSEE